MVRVLVIRAPTSATLRSRALPRLLGCVTTSDVRNVPRAEWTFRTVNDVAQKCNDENTIECNTDAVQALATMSRAGTSRLMVVEDNRLCGIVTLKDLLKFIELKVELEEENGLIDHSSRSLQIRETEEKQLA